MDRPASGSPAGTPSAAAHEPRLATRDHLNEGGRGPYAGGSAGYPAPAGGFEYDDGSTGRACCPDLSDDVQQYYFGADTYLERASPDTVTPNRAGEGGGLWSGSGDGLDATAAFTLDLQAATAPVTLTLASWWDIQAGYDYGYVVARADAGAPWV